MLPSYLTEELDLSRSDIVSIIDELPLWSAPFGLKMLEFIPYDPEQTILDIGSGTGFPLIEIAMRMGNKSKVYGIDIWESAMDRIQQKIDIMGLANIKLIKGSAEKIDLPDNSVDLIVSNNGINNVEDLDSVLLECHRVAKPDSRFFATVNLEDTMLPFYSTLKLIFEELGMETQIAIIDQHIEHKRRPIIYLSEHMKKCGFQISQIMKDEFYYRFASGTTFLNHYFMKLAFLPSWKELVPKELLEIVFEKLEERLNKMSHAESGLSMIIPYVLIEARAE